jgi:hypothetical protein
MQHLCNVHSAAVPICPSLEGKVQVISTTNLKGGEMNVVAAQVRCGAVVFAVAAHHPHHRRCRLVCRLLRLSHLLVAAGVAAAVYRWGRTAAGAAQLLWYLCGAAKYPASSRWARYALYRQDTPSGFLPHPPSRPQCTAQTL